MTELFETAWNCSCGQINNKGNFCPNCGEGRETQEKINRRENSDSEDARKQKRGQDLRRDMLLTFEEAAFGKDVSLQISHKEECSVCHGTGVSVNRDCTSCGGIGRVSRVQQIQVHIPCGVEEGYRLRLEGYGDGGWHGGENGDLYIIFSVRPHKYFRRSGYDVIYELSITSAQVANGDVVEIPTLHGNVRLKIPQGVRDGACLKLNGRGIQVAGSDERGNQLVKINVVGTSNTDDKLLKRLCPRCMSYLDNPDLQCPFCGRNREANLKEGQLDIGTILENKYMLGEMLGKGDFGITYVAWDIAAKRKVAVKEYFPHHFSKRMGRLSVVPSVRAAVNRFARGLDYFADGCKKRAVLDLSPGIVRMRDCIETNGTAYRVMEFVDGIPILEYLKQTNYSMFPIDIFKEIIVALEKANNAGFIHREICPQNILVTKEKKSAVLLDFAAAATFAVQNEMGSVVNVKTTYAPPEMFFISGGVKVQADVYSLAATFYHLVTGQAPMPADVRSKKVQGGEADPLVPPAALNKNISANMDAALLKALSLDIKYRHKSVMSFYKAVSGR